MKKFFSLLLFFFLLIIFISPSMAHKVDTNITIPYSNFSTGLPLFPSSQNRTFFSGTDSLNGDSNLKKSRFVSSKLSLIPRRYGALIPLKFGNPPQTLYFIFHTASGLTWFPCANSSAHENDPKKISMFDPTLSSSSKYPGCHNVLCQFFIGHDALYSPQLCQNCQVNTSQSCSKPFEYKVSYFQGFTTGLLLSDALTIQQQTIPDFIVGCSSPPSFSPNGFAGFGRGVLSLPSQLGIKRFSYCISNSQFIDEPQQSYLILNSHISGKRLNYIKLYISTNTLLRDFYYVNLQKIFVGHKTIEIPQKLRIPSPDGFGGTIIDTGTTFTSMERTIFHSVTREFETQLGKGTFMDSMDRTRSCFNISGWKVKAIPKLAFQFEDGAFMTLPLKNYLINTSKRHIVCLSIVAKRNVVLRGPVIILGYSQQQDFYMEFDLYKQKIGFKNIKCT